MSVAGRTVFRQLQQYLEEVRAQATAMRTQFQQLNSGMKRLLEQRSETFRDLARFYLPDLSEESIARTLSGAREELTGVLHRKERRIDELSGQFDRLDAERQRIESELESVTTALNEKVQQREQLQKVVTAQLADNKEFQQLSKEAVEAEAQLHKNEQRVTQSEQEATEKLPAYKNSRLFQYLYERKFGTPEYTYRGLTRRLDRWVAGLVDYYRARRSYQFLTRTPQLMREEVERRSVEFHKLMDKVEGIERHAADETGLTRVLREGDELGKQRDALVARLDAQKERCQSIAKELLSLQHSQGQFYDEALERFREFLTRTERAVLEYHARQTPETTDDETIARIRQLEREIAEVEPRVSDLSRQCELLEHQGQGLDFVVRRFQQSNFDSERSKFPAGFDVGPFVDRFRKGVTDKDDLWQTIKSRQEFEPTWVEQTGRSGTQVFESPLANVLARAMMEAAGAAMQAGVGRSVNRRTYTGGRSGGIQINLPGPSSYRGPSGMSFPSGGGRGGGFTSGKGF